MASSDKNNGFAQATDSVRKNWPILTAAMGLIFTGGVMVQQMSSLRETYARDALKWDKRLERIEQSLTLLKIDVEVLKNK